MSEGKRTETGQLAGCGDPTCKGLNCGSVVCGMRLRSGAIGVPTVPEDEAELMKPTSHEEAIAMLRRWTESLGCAAPEAFERTLTNQAGHLVSALNGARVKAYLAGIASEQREAKEPVRPTAEGRHIETSADVSSPAKCALPGCEVALVDVFRCVDCAEPFHRECLRSHFQISPPGQGSCSVADELREEIERIERLHERAWQRRESPTLEDLYRRAAKDLPRGPWYAVDVRGHAGYVNVCSPQPSKYGNDFTPVASMVEKTSPFLPWLLELGKLLATDCASGGEDGSVSTSTAAAPRSEVGSDTTSEARGQSAEGDDRSRLDDRDDRAGGARQEPPVAVTAHSSSALPKKGGSQ